MRMNSFIETSFKPSLESLNQFSSRSPLQTSMSVSEYNTPDSALKAATQRFADQHRESKALHDQAVKNLPGGNTRTVLHTDPFPVYIKSGKDYRIASEDGQEYADLAGEFTAGLYGHSRPELLSAMSDVLTRVGMNVGGTTSQEFRYAHELCRRFGLDMVRFTNSGTEANLHALAAARRFTGKRKVVAFANGYHGAVLGFAKGVPGDNNVDMDDWIVVPYNDLDAAKKAIRGEGVAAVLLEGMQGAGGCIVGTDEFLHGVQQEANQAGVVFILDEVMTSRLSAGGLAGMRGLSPDLKTFGKFLGGGLAFGAFGGRSQIMTVFDPRVHGCLSHSGTFNNNTLVTHVGHAGLTQVFTPAEANAFAARGDAFRSKLNELSKGTKLCFTGCGTVMNVHFVDAEPHTIRRAEDITENQALKDLFWFDMLERGFWITRRGFMSLILDTPDDVLDKFGEAVAGFLETYSNLLNARR